jgi:hypothetical protein
MSPSDFKIMVERLRCTEWGEDDIAWSEAITMPATAEDFAQEAIFVICNGGMKFATARKIYDRVMTALEAGRPAFDGLRNVGKAKAIDRIWAERDQLYAALQTTGDLVEFCGGLPYIGKITKYHLAKNFGAQVAKPDVHLQRLADHAGCTAQALCERLAAESGFKVATVDVLLWRACAVGIVDSRTGVLTHG